MNLFLEIAFLFFIGSIIGWCLELVFRRFFSKVNSYHKWINPGFLTGPYLPLYGFSLCTLFLLSKLNVSFIQNPVAQKVVLFILMAFCITVIEFIAGMIFIRGMKIILWDYSNCRGNILGVICPQFSFYWTILSAIYYFLINPYILDALYWLSNHLAFLFVVGFFYGSFVVDVFYTFNVVSKIRKFAEEKEIIVRYELLKSTIHAYNEELKEKNHSFSSLKLRKKNTHSTSEKLRGKTKRQIQIKKKLRLCSA